MKAPRFTIRSLLILVAVVAMLIEGQMLRSRSRHLQAKAAFHANQERLHRSEAAKWIKSVDWAVKRADAGLARAAKEVASAKVAIEDNEQYAKDHADSKIEVEYAEDLRRVHRGRLEIFEMVLQHERQNQANEMESAARRRGYAEIETRLAAYHAALSRKYRRAASRPWFSIAVDPPMPPTVD